MKLTIALFLLVSGAVLLSAGKPASREQCLADCQKKCTATMESCKKKATNKNAIQACERSAGICSSHCQDKVCPEQPAKK